MSLSERDAYIKAMIAKSPTFDDSGDLERVIGEEYDKHSQPLPDGKVWRWGGFLAMFRAGAAWAMAEQASEVKRLKVFSEFVDAHTKPEIGQQVVCEIQYRRGFEYRAAIFEKGGFSCQDSHLVVRWLPLPLPIKKPDYEEHKHD